ncbi:MAG TPA: alkaline phosphatase family protein [Terriglobales bacterium]|jgi:acid phosphatase|nr:alkaline phosphatase family protein [Terriglobales bacterium]
MKRLKQVLLLTVLAAFGVACGSGHRGIPPPASTRVVLVLEENHSFSDVIGNSAMPYLNGLASRYALGTQYFADAHPSLPNYFMLTAGRAETNNNDFTGTVSDDNIVRELVKANKTWRSYAESLPSVGYTGGDAYPYFKHHDPFVYLSDVLGTAQANNVVPFSQFAADLSSNNLPDFSFIIPNVLDDAHDGTLAAADQWLSSNIDPLIKSSVFQSGAVLIVVFDESENSDLAHGGGQVPFIIAGPQIKSGYRSSTFYQHQSTLRLLLSTLGVKSFPGAADSAPDMGEFFK